MVEAFYNWELYKIPSVEILSNRKIFYKLKRKKEESCGKWLHRIRHHIDCCEFSQFTEFLLVDKFFCELNTDEIKSMQTARNWSFQNLCEHFKVENVWKKRMDMERFEFVSIQLTDAEYI